MYGENLAKGKFPGYGKDDSPQSIGDPDIDRLLNLVRKQREKEPMPWWGWLILILIGLLMMAITNAGAPFHF